jgi:hypothetical protein
MLRKLAGCVILWWWAERLKSHTIRYLQDGTGGVGLYGELTGKTTGMPPRTGLLPSSFAASLTHRFSRPLLFQLITVAPYSRTSTESPVGRLATTLPCSECTLGCGPVVEGEIADGLFGRSIVWLFVSQMMAVWDVFRASAVEARSPANSKHNGGVCT